MASAAMDGDVAFLRRVIGAVWYVISSYHE